MSDQIKDVEDPKAGHVLSKTGLSIERDPMREFSEKSFDPSKIKENVSEKREAHYKEFLLSKQEEVKVQKFDFSFFVSYAKIIESLQQAKDKKSFFFFVDKLKSRVSSIRESLERDQLAKLERGEE